ncbi:MAG: pseudaminic acid synthase [Planctomycetota bacterium]|jgi:N-acetylneuraminate synthase
MGEYISINGRKMGSGYPTYIIAEMSANHNKDFEKAAKIIEEASKVGADAIKLQTYTPDTMTINARNEYFKIKGTLWEGKNLYDLYGEAYTPWTWQPKLQEVANSLGLDLFSTPFDSTAVDFLEKMNVPAYKIASFELVDLELLKKVAKTGKPIIMSTGMGSLAEIEEAVVTVRDAGNEQIALLKCTSAYPAPPKEMNLRTIPHLAEVFGLPVGLSDHTLGSEVAVAAVALGACIVEKHFTLSRKIHGPDSAFSLEPHEFKEMVEAIRITEKALGDVHYDVTEHEAVSRIFRRSLFVVQDIRAGETFTSENVRSIRPGYGLHPRYLDEVIGQCASSDIERGTPLSWSLIAGRKYS